MVVEYLRRSTTYPGMENLRVAAKGSAAYLVPVSAYAQEQDTLRTCVKTASQRRAYRVPYSA